jgi:2,3-bisphosphoglycerate-independent phosphoglycerate mutase
MDGYGEGKPDNRNAVFTAKTPNLDNYKKNYPFSKIGAAGNDVGLPEGQMGNSEVGHLNIGAGRIVYQSYTMINKAIKEKTFFENNVLKSCIKKAADTKKDVHLIGLLSDGGVHSHINHFKALLDLSKKEGAENVFIHSLLDGRDVPPRCALKYIDELEEYMNGAAIGKIASVCGRYYGMDRDNRWERVKLSYDAIVSGKGVAAESASSALNKAYERGEDDEFVKPSVITDKGSPLGSIKEGDSVIFVNFRPDRARELTYALNVDDFKGFEREDYPKTNYVCMCRYDEALDIPVAYPPLELKGILAEVLSENNISQLRIAETEKYAHVTFFFNAQIEEPFKLEERILIPSPKVATYDLKPQMSAYEVTEKLLDAIEKELFDVYICNYANCDMVGHTGVFDATIKAVETVDECVGKVVQASLKKGFDIIITADHGNADAMIDDKGGVITAHSLNKVPFILVSKDKHKVRGDGVLADIAPTILELLGIENPCQMSGKSMIVGN